MFGHDPFSRLAHAAETLVRGATEFDVKGEDPAVQVKWSGVTNTYQYSAPSLGNKRFRDSGHATARGITNWLSNTLSYTKGSSIEFLTLGPQDTNQPIDCEMFAWGSWSEWTDCADGTRTRTRTRAVKMPSANGGKACPTDLEETETQSCSSDTDPDQTETDSDPETDGVSATLPDAETSDLSSWAVPAGIGAIALITILALK